MWQWAFAVLLYVSGLVFGVTFKKIPFPFVLLSGLLWGSVVWAVSALLGMVFIRFLLPYNVLLFAVVILLARVLTHLDALHSLTFKKISWMALAVIFFGTAARLAVIYNFTTIGPDSLAFIYNGKQLYQSGLIDVTISELIVRGVFLPLIQSASAILSRSYVSVFAPLMALSLIAMFAYLTGYGVSKFLHNRWLVVLIAFVASACLAGVPLVISHIFYIHVNLPSATFFIVAVLCFWLSYLEDNSQWFVLGMLALLGFTMLRIEAPMFAIAVIFPLFGKEATYQKERLGALVPYLVFEVAYYSFLAYLLIGKSTHILNPMRALLVVLVYAAAIGYLLLSHTAIIQKTIHRHLVALMFIGLILALGVSYFSNPVAMKSAVSSIVINLFVSGYWGVTWFFLVPAMLVLMLTARFPGENDLLVITGSFFLVLFLIDFQAYPQHFLNAGDSANRIMLNILPVTIAYIAVKWGFLLSSMQPSQEKAPGRLPSE